MLDPYGRAVVDTLQFAAILAATWAAIFVGACL